MASPPASAPLIGGHYAVDLARRLPQAGGGLPAYAVIDHADGRHDLMALQIRPLAPPRVGLLQALSLPVEGLLCPLAHGPAPGADGQGGFFIVCPAPPGPPAAADPRPWSEQELIAHLLLPAVQVLAALAARGQTHRAIRPDNVFLGGAPATGSAPSLGLPVMLGAAFAAPPAMLQPTLYEPPYSAMCHPAGRGPGSIADDVYALGVLMITLAQGRPPMAGLDDDTIIRRKLAFGSHAALTAEGRLPGTIADLLRGMLAEDPEHRPPPSLLLDPHTARTRRVAARPPRRAQRALEVGGQVASDARSLAYAMAAQPAAATLVLRGGALMTWLRRSLGDGALAARLEEVLRLRAADTGDETVADAMLAARAIALIDPLAPLCWQGTAFWPDGLGPLLAATLGGDGDLTQKLGRAIGAEATVGWGALRAERSDPVLLRLDARQHRALAQTRGPAGGLRRLAYQLNPLLACASTRLGGRVVARLADLLPALEIAAAAKPERLFDADIAAFAAAQADPGLQGLLSGPLSEDGPEALAAQLRLLARLQERTHPAPLPALTAWVAAKAGPLLDTWQNRTRRTARAEQLAKLAPAGRLGPLLALLDDPVALRNDSMAARAAGRQLATLDAEIARIESGAPARAQLAGRIGQEVAAGIGMMALAGALIAAALG